MTSKRLTCTITPELYSEVVKLIEEGLWPNRAAFVREAVEYGLWRQQIRKQIAQMDLSAGQPDTYPISHEELLLTLNNLQDQAIALRDGTCTETRLGVLLEKLIHLREQVQMCLYIAEALKVSQEIIQLLRSLISEDESNRSLFYKAELAINKLLEYHRSSLSALPKTDVETWREISQTATWRQAIHHSLTGIVAAIGRTSQALIV